MKMKWILAIGAVCLVALVASYADFSRQSEQAAGKLQMSHWLIGGLIAVAGLVVILLVKKGVLKKGRFPIKTVVGILVVGLIVTLAYRHFNNPNRPPRYKNLPYVTNQVCNLITDSAYLAQYPHVVRAYRAEVGLVDGGRAVDSIIFTAEDEGHWVLLYNWQGWWAVGGPETKRPVVSIQGETGYGDAGMCTSWKYNVGALVCWIGTPYAYDIPGHGIYSRKLNPRGDPSHPDCLLVQNGITFQIQARKWLEWLGSDRGHIVLCGNESENGYNDSNNRGFVWGDVFILDRPPAASSQLAAMPKGSQPATAQVPT